MEKVTEIKSMRVKYEELREEVINEIKKFFTDNNITLIKTCEIGCGDSPILVEHDSSDQTFTLDGILLNGDELNFEASNCFDDEIFLEEELSIECLLNIWEWMCKYKESIKNLDPIKGYTRKVRVEWDTEEDIYCDDEELNLPEIVGIPDDLEDDEIADWLSDQYGFCVISWVEA